METTTTSETNSEWNGAAEASAEADATPKKMSTAELELPCLLTDAELLERGEALSKELALIESIKAEASEAAAQHRESRKSSEKVAGKLARTIRTKTEERRVPCTVYHVLSLGLARTIRDDTGEIVSERPLSYAERQPSLFDGDAEDAPATDADGEDDPGAITDPEALLEAGDEEDAGEA